MNKKQEGSLPLHTRCNIATLARLHQYFTVNKIEVSTMSGLLSGCVYMLEEILEQNGMLRERPTLAAAYGYLSGLGLLQKSSIKAGIKKLSTAVRFEGMRSSGIDPQETVPEQYNTIHSQDKQSSFLDEIEEALKKGEPDESDNS